MDRRRRHAGFDQLDPPTVHDLVVGRGRDCHGPAEMMGNAQAHAIDCASGQLQPLNAAVDVFISFVGARLWTS
ncbi:MAG: hypothetical protein ABR540_21615 [Acidimicrobiales bacterium]